MQEALRVDPFITLLGDGPREMVVRARLHLDYCAYADFKEQARKLLGRPLAVNQYRTQFENLSQFPSETVLAFGQRVQDISLRAFPKLDDAAVRDLMISKFSRGLRDDTSRRLIEMEGGASLP